MRPLSNPPTIVPALAHGPGLFGAVLVFSGSSASAGATAKELLSLDDNRLLVALGSAITGIPDVVKATPWNDADLPDGALFVQVAADSFAERAEKLHLVEETAKRHGLTVLDRVLGQRIGEGREAFGFLDGKIPTRAELAAALTPDGDAVLLWMLWQQDVVGFGALPAAEQERVLGVDRSGHRLHDAPSSAHVRRMEGASIVRRGFPTEDRRGLAFVAVGPSPAVLSRALAALDGDALMGFARVKSAATFIVPRDASRVDALLRHTTEERPMTYGKDPMLVTYPTAVSMLEYILKAKELGAFSGPIGDMTVNPYLEPVLRALHEVLAGGQVKVEITQRGNPDIVHKLNEMAAKATADSNDINKKSGYYVTAIV